MKESHRIALVGFSGSTLAELSPALADSGHAVEEFGAPRRFVAMMGLLQVEHHGWRPYDLIVADDDMPGMTSASLVRQLWLADPTIPVVVLCDSISPRLVDYLYSAGSAAVAEKTISPAALCLLVDRTLRERVRGAMRRSSGVLPPAQ